MFQRKIPSGYSEDVGYIVFQMLVTLSQTTKTTHKIIRIKLRIIYFIQLLSLLRQIQVLYTKHLCKVAFLKETLHFKSTVHWGVQYCTLVDLTDKHTKENLHTNTRVLQNMIQRCLPKETTLYLCTNTETHWDLAF